MTSTCQFCGADWEREHVCADTTKRDAYIEANPESVAAIRERARVKASLAEINTNPDFRFWVAATIHEENIARFGIAHPNVQQSRHDMFRALDVYIEDRIATNVEKIVDKLCDRLMK